MKKVFGAILSLFALISLSITSCSADGSGGSSDPEFDVTLCSGTGVEKSEFSTNISSSSANFYITSKNYFDYLNVNTTGTYVDENGDIQDVGISCSQKYGERSVIKYSLTGLPSKAGKYEIVFMVYRLDNGAVNKNVYKKMTLTLIVTSSGSSSGGETTVTYDAPTITTQPVGKTYDEGTTTFDALTVVAKVTIGDVSYQWYKDGVKIEGATNSSYTPTAVTTSSTEYYVIVSNTKDTTKSTKSDVVIVRVKEADELAAPTITTNLAEKASYDKATDILELNIQATATSGTVNYQWYKDGTAISGETNSSYTPTAFGSYYVKVWALDGSKTSAETISKTITIGEKPIAITISGLSETAYVGDSLSVFCTVNVVTSKIEYQWYTTDANSEAETEISGATTSSYTPTAAGKYKCKVTATSKYTGESKTADNGGSCTVTEKAADDPATPTITSNLSTTKEVTEGESVTFSVTASTTDDGVLSYQWYKGGAKLSCTSSSYTISNPKTDDSGEYYVTVINTLNGKTAKVDSVHCTLKVNSKETNGSGSGSFQF